MKDRNRHELWARVLVDELIRNGIRQVFVAPGSRSTPLVMAVASRPELTVRVRIDERCAGFTALGAGKATGQVAAVITTSGTAVANLLPAVVEAAHSETPLLILSADRPPRLRGADANQAIDQERIFGRYTSFYRELSPSEVSDRTLRHLRSVVCQAAAVSQGRPGGPAHLNLPFEKPLEPSPPSGDPARDLAGAGRLGVEGREGGGPFTRIHPWSGGADAATELQGGPRHAAAWLLDRLKSARRPLMVAGPLPQPHRVGPLIQALCARLRIPLLPDPLSGARYPTLPLTDHPGPRQAEGMADEGGLSSGVVAGYDLALGSPDVREGLVPDLIIRLGRTPTSSRLTRWLLELGTDPAGPIQVVVDQGHRWKDHLAVAHELVQADPAWILEQMRQGDETLEEDGSPETDPEREDWLRAWSAVGETVVARLAPTASDGAQSGRGQSGGGRAGGGQSGEVAGPRYFEGQVVLELLPRLAAEDLLFVSSSMPVRDLDSFGVACPAQLRVLGNRGASGIDGILSTATGAALATGDRVVVLMGDLAFLHDQGGLGALVEEGIRVVVIVVNNDGGGIFHRLPIRRHEPHFTPYFATPHGTDLSRLARIHDLPFQRIELRGAGSGADPTDGRSLDGENGSGDGGMGVEGLATGLRWALSLEGSGILEVRTDRDENARVRTEVEEAVAMGLTPGSSWRS
jgi:2-succinyl-5-enolpyruvyl-6-hydroxy-3-cyclohexene-1-carboxylate synthase